MTTPPRALAAATFGLALVGAVAGCGEGAAAGPPPASSEPAPSPSPSLSESEQLEQQNVQDVRTALDEYYALASQVANDGYDGWEELRQFWSSDQWESLSVAYQGSEKDGLSTEGTTLVDGMTVASYEAGDGEPGYERMVVDLCVDASGSTPLDADGSPVPRGDAPPRFVAHYTMQHQGPDEAWLIAEFEGTDRSC
ncbi:hypothetical protein AAG589_13375 [Isoptericola sp. F-RaC21]|uniref:hypothetical protein n=1 Tax=Isoptericola sp. F-RaC21 TaxID=3141452 RepID=UPI00315BCB33